MCCVASADLETSGTGFIEEEEEFAKVDPRNAAWQKAQETMESGSIHRGVVDACNSGGLVVLFGPLQGFLPFSQMDQGRLLRDSSRSLSEFAEELVGDFISVKIIEANETTRRLIFSEKQAVLEANLRLLEEGLVYEGKVNSVTDFGAFVDVVLPDGTSSVRGLVRTSELSWNPVRNPRDICEIGQSVRVKILQLDKEKSHLYLSIKQLQDDPRLETPDKSMPVQSQNTQEPKEQGATLSRTSLPGLQQICEELLNEEGITGFTLGRARFEKRAVSQDMELWLANAPVEDGKFSILARVGRQVQEIQLNSNLDREGIKVAVQRVAGRFP